MCVVVCWFVGVCVGRLVGWWEGGSTTNWRTLPVSFGVVLLSFRSLLVVLLSSSRLLGGAVLPLFPCGWCRVPTTSGEGPFGGNIEIHEEKVNVTDMREGQQ